MNETPSGFEHGGRIVCRRRRPVSPESAHTRKTGRNGIIADHKGNPDARPAAHAQWHSEVNQWCSITGACASLRRSSVQNWPDFSKRFVEAKLLRFSLPAFSEDDARAIVYYSATGGVQDSRGAYLVFENRQGAPSLFMALESGSPEQSHDLFRPTRPLSSNRLLHPHQGFASAIIAPMMPKTMHKPKSASIVAVPTY